MFKLIKIENSGVNVPEPVTVRKEPHDTFKAGSAISIEDGVAANCGAYIRPTYIAAADGKDNSETMLCYTITENMLFEVSADMPVDNFLVGMKLSLSIDDDGEAVGVSDESEDGVAILVDFIDLNDTFSKLIVKF